MKNVPEIRDAANRYMNPEEPYAGETKVLHFLEILRDQVGFEELKKKVVCPLKGRKIGAYYGCLLLRPGEVLQFDDPENPSVMENLIRALGAEPILYPYRNECCGGYISLKEKELSGSLSEKIMDSACGFGAGLPDYGLPALSLQSESPEREKSASGILFHRASGGSPWGKRGGAAVIKTRKNQAETHSGNQRSESKEVYENAASAPQPVRLMRRWILSLISLCPMCWMTG